MDHSMGLLMFHLHTPPPPPRALTSVGFTTCTLYFKRTYLRMTVGLGIANLVAEFQALNKKKNSKRDGYKNQKQAHRSLTL